ncbi:MAG: signal peptidase I [Myxococcales bacterium]|nr:signal peptidase I [Myxococcales bacterium]
MNARRLDRRIKKEARALLKEARGALLVKPDLKGRSGELKPVVDATEAALGKNDVAALRRQLPVLDALVDELIQRPPKSAMGERIESLVVAVALALALRAFVIEAFKIPSSSMYPTLEIGDHIFVNKFIYGMRIPWTSTKFLELRKPARGEVIVFMQPCEPDRDYIKRVVALEGDTVEVRCGVLWVNGVAVKQDVIERETSYLDNELGEWRARPVGRYRETVGEIAYDTFHDVGHGIGAPHPQDHTDFPVHDFPPSCATGSQSGQPAENQALGDLVASTERPANVCDPRLHFVVPKGHVFAMGDNRDNSNDSRFWGAVPLENIKGKALFIWLSYPDSIVKPHEWRWSRIGNFVE